MRKILSLLALLVLFSVQADAQTRNVTGQVLAADGTPIPFASVTVKGQGEGVTADGEGRFLLRNVASGSVLVISALGFAASELTIADQSAVTINLNPSTLTLQEVVVTSAFGIKKSERTTPFSAQVISAEQLSTIRQPNLNNALAGKVAGVQFRGQSPVALNREGFLRIRGGQSLNDRGPIYVVDGTIVSSYDINPDDVENLNVLKGANATALFGARAANGAVVITTKKRGAKDGLGIEVNQALTFDRVYILPRYQNRYAGGDGDFITFNFQPGMPQEWQALDGKVHHDFTDDASWGPAIEGQEYIPWYAFIPGHSRTGQTARLTPQPDNNRDFWNTGITNNTNVNLSQGGQGYNFRLSYTNQSVKGMLPRTSSNRHNLFTAISYDLGSHFTAAANITVSTQKIEGQFNDEYSNQSSGSFTQWFHRDLDMNILKELRGLRTPIGTMASWNFRRNPNSYLSFADDPRQTVYGGNYWYNFFGYFDQIQNQQRRDRLYGDISLTYKLNNNFNIRGTLRSNQSTTNYQNVTTSLLERSGVQSGVLASYSTGQDPNLTASEYNYELIASWNKTFGDFAFNVTAGGNKLTWRRNTVQSNTNNGLNVADLYAITNSKATPTIANIRQAYNVNSVFATGDIEFKRFLSLTWAFRNDWYSTLPSNDNALLSPSIGGAFVFSEFTGDALPWLSFGKLYGSWGKKPVALDPYEINLNYAVNQFAWNSGSSTNFLMTTPNAFPDPALRGSLVQTYEAGIDMRFLRNRLGLNVLYYFERNDQEPLNVAISGVSGFTSNRINIAEIQRKGLEVEISAKPAVGKDFNWTMTKTFHYLIDNTVNRLAPGVPSFTLSGGAFGTRFARAFHIEGKQWGMLRGGGIKRNEEGLPLITTNGFSGGPGWFVNDPNKEWGSIVPKVTGGFQNFFNYKGITLGLTLDYQFGGKFFSLSEQWGSFSGLLEPTAGINDRGGNVRDDPSANGGVRVVGVDAADGKTPVDIYISAYDYYHQFYYQQVAEPFIHDLSFIKLREVSVGYDIPVNRLGGIGKSFQGMNISVIARNPWLIYRKTDNFDPSEISFNHGEDGQFPGTRSLGFNLKLNF